MYKKIKAKQALPVFLPYPKFLINSQLNLSSREVYALLLHRTTLSQMNGWTDDQNNVFIIYPVAELAKDLQCSEMTVKRALKSLEEANLIERKRTNYNGANRIFLKFPTEHF